MAKDAHHSARKCFLLWHANDSPRYSPIYQQMRIYRAHFKRTLRQCKADNTRKQADSLAKHLLSKDSTSFWNEVKSHNQKVSAASTVAGECCSEAI